MNLPNNTKRLLLATCLFAANSLQNFALAAAPGVASGAAASPPDLPATSATLGRLFLTPERRIALDRQRALNIPDEKKVDAPQLRLDGVVIRSSGKRTVWVNGRAINERDVNALRFSTQTDKAGEATIGVPNERGHKVPVGGSVNRETGDVQSPLGSGRVIHSAQ